MKSKRIAERNYTTWLEQYSAGSRRQYERAYDYWLEFLEPHDEQWVLQHRHDEDWGTHLSDFRDWLSGKRKHGTHGELRKAVLSDNTTKSMAAAVRSYLKHVGCTIQLTRAQKEHLVRVTETVRHDYPFNLRVKELLMSVADPTEDYIVSCGVSFGLRVGDFLRITRGQLEPLLEQEPPIAMGELPTEKKGVFAHPFISRDAKEAIERLLRDMDVTGRTSPDEPMLQTDENGVNRILKNLFEKAGVKTGGYDAHFHILRKFLSDNLASVSSGDKWKLIIGKKADSPYIASDCREAYKRVMEFIDINHKKITSVPESFIEIVQKQDARIRALEMMLKHPIKLDTRETYVASLEQRIAELEELVKKLLKEHGIPESA